MQATVLYGERDIRCEDRPEPTIVEASDAIVSLPFTCICGSDLWPYRGIQPVSSPAPMGHEYCGFVEEVGRDVTSVRPGQFVARWPATVLFARSSTWWSRAGPQVSAEADRSRFQGHHQSRNGVRPGTAA